MKNDSSEFTTPRNVRLTAWILLLATPLVFYFALFHLTFPFRVTGSAPCTISGNRISIGAPFLTNRQDLKSLRLAGQPVPEIDSVVFDADSVHFYAADTPGLRVKTTTITFSEERSIIEYIFR